MTLAVGPQLLSCSLAMRRQCLYVFFQSVEVEYKGRRIQSPTPAIDAVYACVKLLDKALTRD